MKRFTGLWAAGVLGVVALLGCSSEERQVASTIGTEGAKIDLQSRASIIVPPGALAEEVLVTLRAVDPPAPLPSNALSAIVEFTPHGTTFAAPATISLQYTGPDDPSSLQVLRLGDSQDTSWEPVGGARIAGGVASFETTRFSYYVIVGGYQCKPVDDSLACNGACECCGGPTCVEVTADPNHCGACGNACGSGAFCASGGVCVPLASASLCENQSLYTVLGELPATLVYVSAEQTADGQSAAAIAGEIAARCGVQAVSVSQAQQGILDPCTNAPLLKAGTTILLVGDTFSQRLAKYIDAKEAIASSYDAANDRYLLTARSGRQVASVPNDKLTSGHDYFVISLTADPARGALVFHVYGLGWEGTPAAVWYYQNVLKPELAAGTRTWKEYLLVEWTDDGDKVKGAGDTFTVLARDLQ